MNKQIRTSKFTKVVACYLSLMMFLEIMQPMAMYALTSGPTQPEFNSFTPIATSDMVDLSSGDFNYNIPIMDVGGYPLNLSYNSGITMDQEASWTGLGWNLNVGQIERQMRGLPDDFRGDEMIYENDMKDNKTVGTNFNFHPAAFGVDGMPQGGSFLNVGIGVQYNNYEGVSFKPSFGVSFDLTDNISVGANFSSSIDEGASVRPSVTFSGKMDDKDECTGNKNGVSFGVGLNSRKGVEQMTVSAVRIKKQKLYNYGSNGNLTSISEGKTISSNNTISGSVSFNDISFTPSKKIGFQNTSFTFDAAFGLEIFGVEGQGQITGYGTYQGIRDEYKNRRVKAFGYENTQYKNKQEGVLDFNREKEQSISDNTMALPVTNYTYDIYTIQGQGVGGMFRPYRSQVSHVYNDDVTDYGDSGSIGVEIGGGNLIHGGVNFNVTPSTTRTGRWEDGNNALSYFDESNTDSNKINYEPFAYKLVGEMNVDRDWNYYNTSGDNKALRFSISGGDFNRRTSNTLIKDNGNPLILSGKIKRQNRMQRNQVVQKITAEKADYDKQIRRNDLAKLHHTAGIRVLQPGGTTYVYGETVYNTKKVEATFDVSGQSGINTDDETIDYNGSTGGNGNGNSDRYLNKVTTPAYAHSYLLSSVLSEDYEDIDDNGPTDNDLGTYTKFVYERNPEIYKWRVPYDIGKVTFNEGIKSLANDNKGNYLYGEKELKFLNRIETKTHVAYFDLENRNDAMGVTAETYAGTPQQTAGRMKRLKSIRLYSKAELKAANIDIADGPAITNTAVAPIKTAHFEYDYSLCKNTPSNSVGDRGKLTLKKVYFTYKNSNMGVYTPYEFNYEQKDNSGNVINNPYYAMKGFDVWGNYKPINENGNGLNNSEYPFVVQDKAKADLYSSAWTLRSIKLPSGGEITINTESDDYQYVQNKKAMQMFKVVGMSNDNDDTQPSTMLYDSPYHHNKYIYVKLSNSIIPNFGKQEFINKYISGMEKDVYFRFMMNMASTKDYVTGYFNIDNQNNINVLNTGGETIAAIPVDFVRMGGGVEAGRRVSPFAKSGWSFGRRYLNRVVYSLGGDETSDDFESIVNDLLGSIGMISELYKGPNKLLEEKGCAKYIDLNKSWIRLQCPQAGKLGGGLRVKSVELSDNWKVMVGATDNIYDQRYGQKYSYNLNDSETNYASSGVATFEPNSSPENPFVKPFYTDNGGHEGKTNSLNYIEEPFGENFFPSPTVTYSKVTVSNLVEDNGNASLSKHGTGKTVTKFYTSKDFPTIVNKTDLYLKHDENKSSLASFLNVYSVNHITASQGYVIETNDMNGKTYREEAYQEGQSSPISYVHYKYNVDENNKLINEFTTIDSDGSIATNTLGVTSDLIADFNESNSNTETFGADVNIASFLAGIFPVIVPIPLPKMASHQNVLHTATTTKVIHKTGVLVEKVAYDLGSTVSTKNLAWDAGSGDILLTQTTNEFNDNYYTFNFPAYWNYDGMGMSYNNIGMEGYIQRTSSCDYDPSPYFKAKANLASPYLTNLKGIFQLGDELLIKNQTAPNQNEDPYRVWVLGMTTDGLLLIKQNGDYIDNCGQNESTYKFTVMRSGYRNLQNANMSSITSMINPIRNSDGTLKTRISDQSFNYTGAGSNPRIINASAVVYTDFWKNQDEENLGVYPTIIGANGEINEGEVSHPYVLNKNPYLYNTKGEWRAQKSYAYLAGRNASAGQINNPRNEGFFNRFNSFYHLIDDGIWQINEAGWQFASSVTQYSPFGAELENKDALNRYSAAQYGYNYTLPTAVASNAKYNEIGYEGFEESRLLTNNPHFYFLNNAQLPTISNTQSHTGKRSVKVVSNQSVKLNRKLGSAVKVAQIRECGYSCSELIDVEGIQIGTRNDPPSGLWDEQNDITYYQEFIIHSKCDLSIEGTSVYNIQIGNSGTTTSTPIYDLNGNALTKPVYVISQGSSSQSIKIKVYLFDAVNRWRTGICFDQNGNQTLPINPVIPSINIPFIVGGYPVQLKYKYPTLTHNGGYQSVPCYTTYWGAGFSSGIFSCN